MPYRTSSNPTNEIIIGAGYRLIGKDDKNGNPIICFVKDYDDKVINYTFIWESTISFYIDRKTFKEIYKLLK